MCWDGDLCLLGYDMNQSAGRLDLALYWQAPRAQGSSYKRFVHLIDPRDGRVLAQNDAVPRDWTYPTNIWEPGEVVMDRLSLALDGLPPGVYELRAGWYGVDGGETLRACHTAVCGGEPAGYHVLSEVPVAPEP
jgi:hypothetical protein